MTYILFNPHANGGKGSAGVEEVRRAYAAASPEVRDITRLDAGTFFRGLTADDEVILCGGDGTINHLINDLDGFCPAAPVRLWRFGTGNDFLRDVTEGMDPGVRTVLLNEYIRSLPILRTDKEARRFINGCGAGVDALVCERMNRRRFMTTRRKENYASIAIRAFFREYKPTTARVTVDGVTREYDRVWMAGVMNGRYQGGGMKFAPDQDRRGDTLCCFVWHGTTPVGTLLRFPFVIKGTHARFTDHCDMIPGREITVELGEPQYLQFDGETLPNVSRYSVTK